jgi:hypothetical protein
VTGVGFIEAHGSQVVTTLAPGVMSWHQADGVSGYDATYYVLSAGEGYMILYYCTPLEPSDAFWTSVIAYGREPTLSEQAEADMIKAMAALKWDLPLYRVNNQDCPAFAFSFHTSREEQAVVATPM